ncbi:hypothetical protein TKK_0009833 [Trichogramma kaykai]
MYFDIKSSTSDEEPHPVMIRKRRYKAGLYKNYEEKKILLDVRTQLKWNDLGSKIKEKNHHKVSMKSIKEKRKTDSSNTEGDSSDDSYSLVNLENHMDVVSFPNPTCRDHDENVHTFEKNSTISSQDYSNLESVESSPEQNEDETYSVDTDYDEDDEDDDEDDNDDEGEKMDPKNNWIHNILFEGYQLSVHMILYSTTKKKFRRQANIICEVCNSSHSITLKSRNYFISVDLEYQLNLLMDNEEIKNEILKSRDKKKSDDDKIIRDIDDSELFKSIPRAKKDEILITYNFSIDGAPLTNSGKLGFWPLQIILNCLTPKLRFKNVLLAGIMSCKSEPKSNLMNLYMSKFLDQAKKLYEEGIPMVDEFKKCISVKFAPLSCPVDTVTRPILQNRLQFNAFYGCSWCYDIGKHVLKVGVRYPLKSDSISRSSRSYQIDVQLAERKKETLENRRKKKNDLTLKGVKGDICQSKLTHFDMVWSFSYEYMHGVLNGVTMQLLKKWYSDPNSKYKLDKIQKEKVEKRLKLIRPTQDFHRLPQPVKDRSYWKSSQIRSWLLHYSLPCLTGLLDQIALDHYSCLVRSVYILLSPEITQEMLELCEMDLISFVGNYQVHYGIESMTFNVHALLHIVESIRKISKKSLNILHFRMGATKYDSDVIQNYCDLLFSPSRLSKFYESGEDDVTFIGKPKFNMNDDGDLNKEFKKCLHNGKILHSSKYSLAVLTDNTMIQLISQIYGKIITIISANKKCFLKVEITEVEEEKPFEVSFIEKIKKKILFFYPLQSGFFSREDIDNRNNENRGRARLPRRPNHYTYWRLKRQRADVLDGVDAQVDLSNRLVVPETEDIDPEEKVKYEMIGEKTYLGVGKMVKTEAWNVTKKRSAWIFLKDVSQMIWGKRTLVNRCLNPSQSYIRLKDRSPRKQVMPRKYKVVKGNNF